MRQKACFHSFKQQDTLALRALECYNVLLQYTRRRLKKKRENLIIRLREAKHVTTVTVS